MEDSRRCNPPVLHEGDEGDEGSASGRADVRSNNGVGRALARRRNAVRGGEEGRGKHPRCTRPRLTEVGSSVDTKRRAPGEPDERRVFDPVGATERRERGSLARTPWRAATLPRHSHKHLSMETTHRPVRFLEAPLRLSQEHRGRSRERFSFFPSSFRGGNGGREVGR